MFKYSALIFLLSFILSQTTGKISGTIVDKKTSDPLPGANVYLEGTSFGTASDGEGRFTIINIKPGTIFV